MDLNKLKVLCDEASAFTFYDQTGENDALVSFLTSAKKYMPLLIAVAEAADELANSYMGVAGERFRFTVSPTKLRNALAELGEIK
jgi:hypothetical protein